MGLEKLLKQRLSDCLHQLKHNIKIGVSLTDDIHSKEMRAFLDEMQRMSSKISVEETVLSRSPSFTIAKAGEVARIEFAGLPLGHEFDSFILALQHLDSESIVVEQDVRSRLEALHHPVHIETYVSLKCQRCPDIVQQLNDLAICNRHITHTVIDGKVFCEERVAKHIFTVPTVCVDGKELVGRQSATAVLDAALGETFKIACLNKPVFDVLIIGGGPAGNSAAIYAKRKGLIVGMVVDDYGGKLKSISSLSNMISMPYIEGAQLLTDIEIHLNQYEIDVIKNQRVIAIHKQDDLIQVILDSQVTLSAKTIILAVGVTWQTLNIPGEAEFFTKGVTNCPHCDGPLFSGKDVAIIGGGNPALEGAIDLANLANHVYLLVDSSELTADKVLIDKLKTLSQVTVITSATVLNITGQTTVTGLIYCDQESKQEYAIDVTGVFVQKGLIPNTAWLQQTLELTELGEIVVDGKGMTSIPGVFAAGDCTNAPYKQVIIAMGSGATAALGAFDYLMKH